MDRRGNEQGEKREREGGREGRVLGFLIITNIQKLNISLIVRGEAVMKDPNEHNTSSFAVRVLKLF